MKKVIIWIFVIIAILAVILGVLYVVDMYRIENNKPVVFSTWGYDYVPPVALQEDKIELAIIDFLVDRNNKESIHYNNEKWFVSLEKFLIEEKSKSLYYVYAWALEESYYLEDENIKIGSGSSIPYKFVLERNNDEYVVTDSQIPRDGSYYAKDIDKIFPKLVVTKIDSIYTDGTMEELKEDIQNQVKKYFNSEIFLTLEVIYDKVYEKGDKLTWSDFEQYKSTEIGSGLYILLYEVDHNYKLMIGGVPAEDPMYIRLVSQKDNEEYIDIRYDNIEQFLSRTSSTAEEENSFIGTVLEETTTYMIVEPNEDEEERKSADKIRINYGVDHNDYLFGVGRKVLITYSGYIMETYPAQINTNNISVDGYLDFKLSFVKQEENMKSLSIVVNLKEIDKYEKDIDIIMYDLKEINVSIDGVGTYSLKDALLSGKITKNGLIRKATIDSTNNLNREEMYKDGGSILWTYDDMAILKMNTLDGDNDIYIGTSNMTINGVNERKANQKL